MADKLTTSKTISGEDEAAPTGDGTSQAEIEAANDAATTVGDAAPPPASGVAEVMNAERDLPDGE